MPVHVAVVTYGEDHPALLAEVRPVCQGQPSQGRSWPEQSPEEARGT